MSDDSDHAKPCIICSQQNQQMLMLSCIHDPCITCAAKYYIQNERSNSIYYQCQICHEKTSLDTSTIVELKNVYNKLKINKKYNYKQSISTNYTKNNSSHDIGAIRKLESPQAQQRLSTSNQQDQREIYSFKNSMVSNKRFHNPAVNSCSEHPEDHLSYYCFTCYKMICPECAIHGQHTQHEVQANKKAIREIKQNLNELKDQMGKRVGILAREREESKLELKEEALRNKSYHEEIRTCFSSLRNLLNEKEKQFVRKVDQNNEENCIQIRQQSSIVDHSINQFQEFKKLIDQLTQNQDFIILQNYASTQIQCRNLLEKTIEQQQTSRKMLKMCNYQNFNTSFGQIYNLLKNVQISFETMEER